MLTHNLIQGSPEWHAYRAANDNASDAPAMMGVSSHKTRDELLAEHATGIRPEFSRYIQERILDKGHEFERLARPLAETIIGEELYPCTGSVEGSRLSASFDGLTMIEDTAFEHKRLNERLRAVLSVPGRTGADLPMEYQVQMEQQCAVSLCEKVLFMASDWAEDDTLIEEMHCWYTPNPELRARILAGWAQFHKDVAVWVPPEAAPAPVVAKQVAHLPVVFDMRVEGKLVACNIEQYKPAALAYIAAIGTELVTDQDFADADADAKFCRDSADKLELAIEQAMGQMGDINQALSTVREIAAAFDAKGLSLEKLVKARKDAIKQDQVLRGQRELAAHIASLNARLEHPYMPQVPADFGDVVKNKRTVESLRNAVNTELARAKIEASAIADRIDANLKTMQRLAGGYTGMLPDAATLVLKAADDFEAAVNLRVAERVRRDNERLEAERERIRQEEQAKLQREAEGKARAEAAELARQHDEALAKQRREDQALHLAATNAEAAAQAVIAQAASPAQAPVAQVPVAAPAAPAAPADVDDGNRINLGAINEHLAPIKLDAAGLAELGFDPVATVKASKLYRAGDLPAIRGALVLHLSRLSELEAA